MQKMMWMLGIAGLLASAACSPKDRNFITGSSDFTSVAVAIDPSSESVVVGDSVAFTTTVTLVPQGSVVSNGADVVSYTVGDPNVAHVNDSGYLQGDHAGTTTLVATYTDRNHADAQTTSNVVAVTVSGAP
jgi:uncharacterized protein YjdB